MVLLAYRCAGVKERIRLRDGERRQVLVRIHRVNEQIALKPMVNHLLVGGGPHCLLLGQDAPYCEGGCGGDKHGTCVALEGEKANCMCNPGDIDASNLRVYD